jgi:peptidoglycan/xylan/chitin deacetylase (PgdA/CDA1 family)
MSVGQALSGEIARRGVVLTFDDGCETDLLVAAPLLRQLGFSGTFYVVAGFLGRRGYMSPGQLRELSDLQFEIGCHSMSHAYLTDLEPARLFTEIVEAKDRLQQLIGRKVDHISCPGGRWSPQIACRAREAGYASVATSRPGTNYTTTDRFRLARMAITHETSLADFDALCRGKGLFKWRAQEAVLRLAKGMIGNSMYEKVRASLLRTNRP